jgi:hypothetical protein
MDKLVLKLECNKRTTSSFIEEEAPFQTMYMTRRESMSWSRISRRLKPGITVLAKVSSNSTNRPLLTAMQNADMKNCKYR